MKLKYKEAIEVVVEAKKSGSWGRKHVKEASIQILCFDIATHPPIVIVSLHQAARNTSHQAARIKEHKKSRSKIMSTRKYASGTSRNPDELALIVVEEQTNPNLEDEVPMQDNDDNYVNDLISELKVLKLSLPERPMSSMDIFEYVRKMDSYPNISIAYRILFTVPVIVASAERSFSKLKLLKNYLRSTMSQQRLNGLATLCIEKKLLDEVDSNTIINDFASRNVRRNF
ncbi:hypothetical protein SASPL_137891 [Salvia splendens]|uniref:HAT C-terminal dimerisation domain-containing protein n=1 Tax=Salvia splendens TaxID=180675 RepID=A0A8X8WU71_SALSN|nr:hypothetical protein SASPL_137891 [Salvia splendens]